MLVSPVVVKVKLLAPEVVRFPPRVMVELPLFTPVPPLADDKTPDHPKVWVAPDDVIVTFVSLANDWTAVVNPLSDVIPALEGVAQLGTPPAKVRTWPVLPAASFVAVPPGPP